jgi:hypothetical protein
MGISLFSSSLISLDWPAHEVNTRIKKIAHAHTTHTLGCNIKNIVKRSATRKIIKCEAKGWYYSIYRREVKHPDPVRNWSGIDPQSRALTN